MLKRNTSKYALFLLLYSYSTKMSNFEAFLKSLSCYFMNSNPEAIFDILSGYPIWLSWFAREEISKYILIHLIHICKKYSIIQYTLFWYTLRYSLEKKSEFCFKDSQHQQKKCIADFSESMLKRKIWKNVLLISMAFMVLFTSFQSMASLQSSINKARKMSIFAGKCNICLNL